MKSLMIFIALFFSMSFYGQGNTFAVIKHTDNDYVIPKGEKLVYRGLPNELFIDVPNSKSFKVSGNYITQKDKNTYYLNPIEGSETTVTIDIVLKNNKKVTENHIFKIKNIKAPVTTINGQQGNVKFTKNQLNNAKIEVVIPDENTNFGFLVSGFTVTTPDGKIIKVMGNKIDDTAFKKISASASKYDQLTICDVKFRPKKGCSGITVCKTTPNSN